MLGRGGVAVHRGLYFFFSAEISSKCEGWLNAKIQQSWWWFLMFIIIASLFPQMLTEVTVILRVSGENGKASVSTPQAGVLRHGEQR